MAYRIEGKDIVISGFEQGIADTPYSGIADMRNMEIISVPGEASVQFAQTAVSAPPVRNAVAFTAQNAGDTITVADISGFYKGVAIVLNTNTAGGLSTGIVYYVHNIVGSTFQLTLAPASSSAVVVSSDGSGTFTTYQYGNQRGLLAQAPVSYWVDRTGELNGTNAVWLTDGSNYVWTYMPAAQGSVPAYSLIFMGNIGGVGADNNPITGIVVWRGYAILFGLVTAGIDVADINVLWNTSPATAWDYGWETGISTQSTDNRIYIVVSQEDGSIYFTSGDGLGSIIETPGENFDPTDSNTYTISDETLLIPDSDEATCIAELGSNLIIGGRNQFVYVWNKIDPGFSGMLNFPDFFTSRIVAASQNAYIFAGNRGRIYITNGSGINLYRKVPDYVTGNARPYIKFWDANFTRNQLIFSFTVTTNAGVTLDVDAGVWAIDLETDAMRMLVKTTNSTYAGTVPMVAEMPPSSRSTPGNSVAGVSVTAGWFSGTTYTVDRGTTSPYTNYESYLQTDMIPVGTFLNVFTPSQIEWKTSAPLVSGEGIRISQRSNISDSFTLIGESTTAGAISDYYQSNFEKIQWVQFLIETKSTASSPSFTRLTEMRIRDWPSA